MDCYNCSHQTKFLIYCVLYVDEYIQNSTIADICIFLSILICSYILLSTFNRVIIGIIQPSKSGFVDYMFGSIFGLLRGYIIVVLIFSSINASFPYSSWPKFTQKRISD